jgi:hypothetical protein
LNALFTSRTGVTHIGEIQLHLDDFLNIKEFMHLPCKLSAPPPAPHYLRLSTAPYKHPFLSIQLPPPTLSPYQTHT